MGAECPPKVMGIDLYWACSRAEVAVAGSSGSRRWELEPGLEPRGGAGRPLWFQQLSPVARPRSGLSFPFSNLTPI